MESIAITAAIIALPTFLTEIIQLGQGIKDSLNQVGRNWTKLRELSDDVIRVLTDLEEFYRGRKGDLEGSNELQTALSDLRSEMRRVLEHCQQAFPENNGVARVQFKAWLKRKKIEAELLRLREHIQNCYIRFHLLASARIEYRLVELDNDQHLRFSRLELYVVVLYSAMVLVLFGVAAILACR